MSLKRQRSSSPLPSPSPSLSPSPPPETSKLFKITQDSTHAPLYCSLPPTCSQRPTLIASNRELESHYATFHSFVCEDGGCNCVFPDARLLELHIAECHDPIMALKKERGEKTFACHLPSCPRLFLTPKARRLHLIQSHGYPKAYFFAVTNKGIGGLLSKWGQGVSLIRGEWKPRLRDQEMESASDGDSEHFRNNFVEEQQSPRADDDLSFHSQDDHTPKLSSTHSSESSSNPDSLVDAMGSLKLIPNKIRFGRGGKKGGFVHPAADHGKDASPNTAVDLRLTAGRRCGGRRCGHRKTNDALSNTNCPDTPTQE